MTKKKEKEEDIIEQKDAEKEIQEEIVEREEEKEVAEPEKKTEESENKEQEYLDGWKRCQADFENYKKRRAEAQRDLTKYACLNVVMEIFPILDNFHASTNHVPEEQKDTPWVVGIMHIRKQLESTLATYGVTEIETKIGDDFNPELHEAVKETTEHKKQNMEHKTQNTEQKTESKEQGTENTEHKNKVKKIVQRGYKMDGKVIRAARVIVD